MKREDLDELHYITPINNVPSICIRGILAHNKVKSVSHESCAMNEIQERRERVVVPGGFKLHDYANLYFHARNPMMYKRRGQHMELCVLGINTRVLDLPGVVIVDCNAASDIALFKPAPDGLDSIDKDLVYAESWDHSDIHKKYRHRLVKCAEVLVPNKIEPEYIEKAYLSSTQSRDVLHQLLSSSGLNLQLVVNSHLFFC